MWRKWPSFRGEGWYTSLGRNWYTLSYHLQGGNIEAIYNSDKLQIKITYNQLSYISGVDFGHGLLKCGSTIVPFMDHFPRSGRLYQLMTTKMSERVEQAS